MNLKQMKRRWGRKFEEIKIKKMLKELHGYEMDVVMVSLLLIFVLLVMMLLTFWNSITIHVLMAMILMMDDILPVMLLLILRKYLKKSKPSDCGSYVLPPIWKEQLNEIEEGKHGQNAQNNLHETIEGEKEEQSKGVCVTEYQIATMPDNLKKLRSWRRIECLAYAVMKSIRITGLGCKSTMDDLSGTLKLQGGLEMKLMVALKQQIHALEHLLRCKVCLDSDACMVFFPCRHMATCEYCGSFLDKCPVCRALIEEAVKVNKKQ